MDTREKIAVMQAFVEGEKIQQKFIHEDEWMDIDEPEWSWCDFEYRVKTEDMLPKTWEEFCKTHPIQKGEAYINMESNSMVWEASGEYRSADRDKLLLPDEKDAYAMLALCQLIQLRDCYNQGWRPDWQDETTKYIIYVYSDNIVCVTHVHISNTLTFKSKELRDEFYKNFKDLIEIAKPLL